MPMPLDQLRAQLSAIEPDDSTYVNIGASEVGLLGLLLADEDSLLAARAAYALSRIDSESAHAVVLAASESARPEVRVAVAASAGALPPGVSDEVLSRLLYDSETGVRKFAVKSTSARNSDAIRQRVEEIATTDVNTAVRKLATETARLLPPP